VSWTIKIFGNKESGSAILPVLLAIGIAGTMTAILTKRNTDLMRLGKKRSTISDYKDIKNNLDHIMNCDALFESLTVDSCGSTNFIDSFVPLVRYDGKTLIKKPDNTGYTLFGGRYILAAKCTKKGYMLIEAAKILQSSTPPAKYIDETEHKKLGWYNLFIGREDICGELPYFNERL